MNRFVFILFLTIILGGCSSYSYAPSNPSFNGDSSALLTRFEPIAKKDTVSIVHYWKAVVDYFESKNLVVSSNQSLFIIQTAPTALGVNRWRRNREKWHLTYEAFAMVIQSQNGQIYWGLELRISGTRSGHEPRGFSPGDFAITEKIYNKFRSELSQILQGSEVIISSLDT